MNRCLLVATDGSSAGQSALRYAIDFASAMQLDEIACLCVREEERSAEAFLATASASAELALATGGAVPVLVANDGPIVTSPFDPEAILDTCSALVAAAGFRFTPITCSEPLSALLARLDTFCRWVFFGRAASGGPGSRCLDSMVGSLLESSPQSVFVAPAEYRALERIVIAHSGREPRQRAIDCGATWARALHVPLLVMTAVKSRADASRRQAVIRESCARLGWEPPCETCCCQPHELPTRLRPNDLLVLGRHRRSWPLRLWCGSTMERILLRADGPVCVLAPELRDCP